MAGASVPYRADRLPFHYGWLVALAAMTGSMACIGIGRFALGMLLPSMGASLSLSYSEMGFIGTGNFVGYMVSVAIAGHLVRYAGFRRTITVALVVVAVSMMAVGRAGGFVELLLVYFLTGLATGFANIPLLGLTSRWFSHRHRGAAAGIVVGGSGLGVIISGAIVPVINGMVGAEGWRLSWLVLGGIALVAAGICYLVLRDQPKDVGLRPVGFDGENTGETSAPAETPKPGLGITLHLGMIFMVFGFTYAIYATFIVTTLVDERGFTEAVAGQFWTWVGFLSIFSALLFGMLSDRLGRKAGFVIIFLFHTVAYGLVGFNLPEVYLYASIGLFGISAWSIPTVMIATVGDYAGPRHAATSIGAVTAMFGLGQVMGPAIAGILADASGTFSSSYLMAASLTAAAIVLALFLKRPAITY